jgi:hypothetical protein
MSRRSCFRAPGLCLTLALVLASAGCLSDPDKDPVLPPPPESLLKRSSVEETLEYYTLVWKHKLYTEYELLLHDQFEFCPLERDAEDFAWLTSPCWPKTVELQIAAHMFDPNFSGENNSIHAIGMTLTELSRRDLGNGRTEVTCILRGEVLTSENNGWSFDTRFLIDIIPDPDEPGLFQIIKQTEIDPF